LENKENLLALILSNGPEEIRLQNLRLFIVNGWLSIEKTSLEILGGIIGDVRTLRPANKKTRIKNLRKNKRHHLGQQIALL